MTSRQSRLALFAMTTAIGAAVVTFVAHDVVVLVTGFERPLPVIVSEPHAAAGVILSVMTFAIAGICLVPEPGGPTAKRRKQQFDGRSRWVARALLFVLGCIVAAGMAPLIQYGMVDYAATQRGYVRCPPIVWPRHQPDRWALPGHAGAWERCPKEGAAPNS